MGRMNAQLNLPQIKAVMMEFEKQVGRGGKAQAGLGWAPSRAGMPHCDRCAVGDYGHEARNDGRHGGRGARRRRRRRREVRPPTRTLTHHHTPSHTRTHTHAHHRPLSSSSSHTHAPAASRSPPSPHVRVQSHDRLRRSEQLVNQVMDELGLGLNGELASTPATATAAQEEAVGPEADLQVRRRSAGVAVRPCTSRLMGPCVPQARLDQLRR